MVESSLSMREAPGSIPGLSTLFAQRTVGVFELVGVIVLCSLSTLFALRWSYRNLLSGV